MNLLKFNVVGHGVIIVNTDKCERCSSKACVEACPSSIYEIKESIPILRVSEEDILKGACTECLACEFACELYGEKAINIIYEMPNLVEYIGQLEKMSLKPVWK